MSYIPELDEGVFNVVDTCTRCVLVNVISLFGIAGNCINIAVLRRHGFSDSTNIVLIALSVADLFYCVTLPLARLSCVFRHIDLALAISADTFASVYLFVPKFLFISGFWYVGFIAVERFVAVYFPFHVSSIFRRRVVLIFVLFTPTVLVGLLFPLFFTYTHVWTYSPELNRTIAVPAYTQFFLDHQSFLNIYMWVFLTNLFLVTSLIVVTLCCIAIAIKLIYLSLKREQMTIQNSGIDFKVVKMLVTVCVIYICVQTPVAVINQFYHSGGRPSISRFTQILNNIIEILYALNASANFVVYVRMSRKFKATYKQLLSCRKDHGKANST